jgi:hypothetical protein
MTTSFAVGRDRALGSATVISVHEGYVDVKIGGSAQITRGLRVVGGTACLRQGDTVLLKEADGVLYAQSFCSGATGGAIGATEMSSVTIIQSTGCSDVGFIWMSAKGGDSPTTNGAARERIQLPTNSIPIVTYAFDQATNEYLFWNIASPDDWDAGTVKGTFYWTPKAGSGGQVAIWGLQGRAYATDEALDQAMGTAQEVSSTFTAVDDLIISPETSEITLAGNAAAGNMLIFRAYRNAESDGLAGDARLIGVLVEYARTS